MQKIKFCSTTSKSKLILFLTLTTFISALSLNTFSANATSALASSSEKSYIVVLRDKAVDSDMVSKDHAKRRGAKVSNVYRKALKGYSAKMSTVAAQDLAKDPSVDFIEEDKVVSISTAQNPATWGLDRIDQRALFPLNKTFNYTATGSGVKAYIIDTGVRSDHVEFGGRVVSGFDSIDGILPADDCNGHGTHVAGTIGGKTYGVAKNVSLIAVRVLDCSGSGTWSKIIAGIDFVTIDHKAGQPAVANMSISGAKSSAVNLAVANSIADGVTYTIAAGNNAGDACLNSPASVPNAITVGATHATDARASFSNYGKCLDWYAPGVSITSAYHTSTTTTAQMSGTSMASPHTAGVAALYLQNYPKSTPQQVRDSLYNLTTKGIVTDAKVTANNHLLFTNL